MDHKKIYDNLIKTRLIRIPDNSIYYERHHIIPRSMGGLDDESNLVKLTAREHFVAHWLLWRIYRTRETAVAFFFMTGLNKRTSKYIPSSRFFEESRIAASEASRLQHLGKTLSQETKNKIGNSQRGKRHPSKRPADIGEKISKGLVGHIVSNDTREKIGNANKGNNFVKDLKWINNGIYNKRVKQEHILVYLQKEWNVGKLGTSKGFKHSSESKLKISNSLKQRKII